MKKPSPSNPLGVQKTSTYARCRIPPRSRFPGTLPTPGTLVDSSDQEPVDYLQQQEEEMKEEWTREEKAVALLLHAQRRNGSHRWRPRWSP